MPTSTRPHLPFIPRPLYEGGISIKTLCISAESTEAFQSLFDNAMDKILAIRTWSGTGGGEITYAFEQGRFIAFIPYGIVARQKDFDMSLSPEALRTIELQSYEAVCLQLGVIPRTAPTPRRTERVFTQPSGPGVGKYKPIAAGMRTVYRFCLSLFLAREALGEFHDHVS